MRILMAMLIRRALFDASHGYLAVTNCTFVRYRKSDTRRSLDEIQKERKNQAQRSVLFIHKSSKDSLLRYCHNYGDIGSVHFFKKIDNQCALIEFSHISGAQRLINNTKHFPNSKRIPLGSHCLHFSSNSRNHHLRQRNISKFEVNNSVPNDLTDIELLSCSSVDSQMELLHKKQSLSELDIRLRYFIANEVECLFRKIFPQSESFLFGSSVTGLGRCNGDVDIILDIEQNNPDLDEANTDHNRAYFCSKIRPMSERHFSQDLLASFGSLMKNFMPQFVNVNSVLRARIPIVKFKHSLADIEGDLCAGNMEAKEMARILFQLFQQHDSILPLIFVIRQWAKCCELTKGGPTQHISNFMLTLLVIFYLQNHPLFLLPAIKNLQKSQNKLETLKPINKEDLLLGFFKFYTEIDFTNKGISVYEGTFIPKSDKTSNGFLDPLYLENPIERHLNAAKIVLEPYLAKFQKSCEESYDILSNSPGPSPTTPWGLLRILTTHDVQTDDESKFFQESATPTNDEEISL